jgi:hypothetical protein
MSHERLANPWFLNGQTTENSSNAFIFLIRKLKVREVKTLTKVKQVSNFLANA